MRSFEAPDETAEPGLPSVARFEFQHFPWKNSGACRYYTGPAESGAWNPGALDLEHETLYSAIRLFFPTP